MPFTTIDSPTGKIITLEAIWQIQLDDFPAFTVVDDKGGQRLLLVFHETADFSHTTPFGGNRMPYHVYVSNSGSEWFSHFITYLW